MKKLFSFFLAVLLFSVTAPVFAEFSDTHGTSSREAVEFLEQNKVVVGFGDGTFRPDQKITRAEFLKITLSASTDLLAKDEECVLTEKTFPDVRKQDWFYSVVCVAVKNGIVDGYPDGRFRPNAEINFAEASKIVARIKELNIPQNAGSDWFSGYVEALHRERVIPGNIRENNQNITRGDMAEMTWGLETGYEVENDTLGDLPQIESCEELTAQLEKYQKRSTFGYESGVMRDVMRATDVGTGDGDGDGDGEASPAESMVEDKVAANEYSTTNIQEFGVDEADIIKNNGSHIILVKGNTVRIVKAYPPTELEQVAVIKIDDENFYPQELYLDGDTLVIVGNATGSYQTLEKRAADFAPDIYPYWGNNSVRVVSFDISDPSEPKKIRSVSFDGNYVSSRKIGSTVYLVANKYQGYSWSDPIPLGKVMPAFSDSANGAEKTVAPCNQVRYFPNFRDPNFLIVAAIPVEDTSEKVNRQLLLGSGQQIYASSENLYVTRTTWDEVFWEGGPDSGWNNAEFTEIFKFALDGNQIDFVAKGQAEGNVLNQFAMSEYDDHFRIATQKGDLWGQNLATSNVFVFDENMKEIGRLEGIAPGEHMYSVRFVGSKAYMVTFKKVDPLFVIDLSDPENPEILGKLKIPGFSDYLHPYDENHIIGFGKDAADGSEDEIGARNLDFAWYQGMKIAIFDVSDVENPKQLFSEVIGDRGTESELLHNHKALLFDREKNILAFPVVVYEVADKSENAPQTYGEPIFSGAYIYHVDLENGFTLQGKVTNFTEDDFKKSGGYFYGDPDRTIQRVIYIGDYFYAIAQNIIKALDWDDISEVNTLTLDEKQCQEIYIPSECSANPSCRTVWQTNGECYEDNGELICDDKLQTFLRCEEK